MGVSTCKRCGSVVDKGSLKGDSFIVMCRMCRTVEEEIAHQKATAEIESRRAGAVPSGDVFAGFNLLSPVEVYLTPEGQRIARADDLYSSDDGMVCCSMKEFMRTFGPHLWSSDVSHLIVSTRVLVNVSNCVPVPPEVKVGSGKEVWQCFMCGEKYTRDGRQDSGWMCDGCRARKGGKGGAS